MTPEERLSRLEWLVLELVKRTGPHDDQDGLSDLEVQRRALLAQERERKGE